MSSTSNNSGKNLVSIVYSGNSCIPTEKLNGKNCLNWSAAVKIWFLGKKLSDHLTMRSSQIAKQLHDDWEQADYLLVSLLWNSIGPSLLVHYRSYMCYHIWRKPEVFILKVLMSL